MSAPPPRWPILETIRRWRRSWRATGEPPFELQCAGTIEVERIAQELGLSSSELRSLVSRPDERELLAKRVAGWSSSLTAAAVAIDDSLVHAMSHDRRWSGVWVSGQDLDQVIHSSTQSRFDDQCLWLDLSNAAFCSAEASF